MVQAEVYIDPGHVVYDDSNFQIISFNDGCNDISDYGPIYCNIVLGDTVIFDIACKKYACWLSQTTLEFGIPPGARITPSGIA